MKALSDSIKIGVKIWGIIKNFLNIYPPELFALMNTIFVWVPQPECDP